MEPSKLPESVNGVAIPRSLEFFDRRESVAQGPLAGRIPAQDKLVGFDSSFQFGALAIPSDHLNCDVMDVGLCQFFNLLPAMAAKVFAQRFPVVWFQVLLRTQAAPASAAQRWGRKRERKRGEFGGPRVSAAAGGNPWKVC